MAQDEQIHDGNDRNHGMSNDNKVVRLPTLKEREEVRHREAAETPNTNHEPLINLPPATLVMMSVVFGVFVFMQYVFPLNWAYWTVENFGFTPGKYTTLPFTIFALFSPVTYMTLHASWLHVIMNGVMMVAFGSGIEKWIGSRRMVIFFLACGLIAALTHFLAYPFSHDPVIGASGGLSGLFAAALVMINKGQRELGGPIGILPFAIFWIGITIAFGMIGSPDGNEIAWAAHVGGFIGGFIVLKLMKVS